jgi:exopolysaccharide biosynthesis protein
MSREGTMKNTFKLIRWLLAVAISIGSIWLTKDTLEFLMASDGVGQKKISTTPVDKRIMDAYDMDMNNRLSDALDGMLDIEKVYWLNDDILVAPEPDQENFGTFTDPRDMAPVLEQAKEMLGVENLTFSVDATLMPGSQGMYYLDETIFAVTWKTVIDGGVYTLSEVKIKHPSQLRRYLAGQEFGSAIQLTTTQMAAEANAVVASSGDFYAFRNFGVIVYDGVVQRVNGTKYVDTVYINDKGDLLFSYAGELTDMESAQAFVDENNIRFSMAFGPVLIENGKQKPINEIYALGQVMEPYARAALCQKGELHYLVAVINAEGGYKRSATLQRFSDVLMTFDVDKAYTLDGGQTAVIAMNDKLINRPVYGSQRNISDIFYFATAIPD